MRFFSQSPGAVIPAFCQRTVLLVLSVALCGSLFLPAQPAQRERELSKSTLPTTEADGAETLRLFRAQRIVGDYAFDLSLRHYPRRAPAFETTGQLLGTWNAVAGGPRMRLRLADGREVLLQGGPQAEAWQREHKGDDWHELLPDAWFEPLAADMLYTPFDLLMPYVWWEEYRYLGRDRSRGRTTEVFLLYPPENLRRAWPRLGAVRMELDAQFNALVRVQLLGVQGEPWRRLQVVSFQQFEEQWLLKSVEAFDVESRAKTRLQIEAVALDLELEAALFVPGATATWPEEDRIAFQPLP